MSAHLDPGDLESLDPFEAEWALTTEIDAAIFEAEHAIQHGTPAEKADARRQLRQLLARRDRILRNWQATLAAEDYRLDKLAELETAPDALAAADALARWDLSEGRYRVIEPLPAAENPSESEQFPTAAPAQVRAAVHQHIARFFAAEGRRRLLLDAQTGSNKTGASLQELARAIARRKAAKQPHRAVLMLPTLDRSEEVAERARGWGISVAVFRGRGDPAKPNQPCRNLEAVGLARRAGQDIRTAVCGPAADGGRCGFHDSCEYLAGLARAAKADLVIVAHNFLFETLPKPLRRDLGSAVVDEDFSQLADNIFTITADTFGPEPLGKFPLEGDETGALTGELAELHHRLLEAVRACLDGYLTAAALRAAGLTPADARRARELNWQRKQPVTMKPGMDIEARKVAADRAAINGQLGRIAAAWHAIEAIVREGESAAGLISTRLDMRRSGSQTLLTIRGQREPAAWLAELPILMLGATSRIEDVRRVFRSAEAVSVPRAATPHTDFHLVTGTFGKSGMDPNRLAGTRRLAAMRRLAGMRALLKIGTWGGKSGLVVGHKGDCEDAFAGMPDVATAHHGDIAGSDRYRDADLAFIIGGTFAKPKDIASIAAARGGGAIEPAKPIRIPRTALLTSSAAVSIDTLGYEDPAMQAVHSALYDGSITQAAGRVRPMNRDAANPATVYIFANHAPPFPVASIRRWRDMKPDRFTMMAADDDVCLSTRDMHAYRQDLFRTVVAAEHALARAGGLDRVREAIRELVRHDTRPWVSLLYTLPGQGHRPRERLIPAEAEAATLGAIETMHGPIVRHLTLPFTPGSRREVTATPEISNTYPAMGVTLSAPQPLTSRNAATHPVQEHPPDG